MLATPVSATAAGQEFEAELCFAFLPWRPTGDRGLRRLPGDGGGRAPPSRLQKGPALPLGAGSGRRRPAGWAPGGGGLSPAKRTHALALSHLSALLSLPPSLLPQMEPAPTPDEDALYNSDDFRMYCYKVSLTL